MPLKVDIKKLFTQRTERAKGVDLHSVEPWILANLYSGNVCIWNYNEQSLVKSFEVSDLPVRACKFIERKQWIVTGADDNMIRVYNYNTMDKVVIFEAHTDYIRSIAVHPTLPCVLSASDDMVIKLWDWDKGWQCTQLFEGHSHYVMQIVINPKDTNTFASASLDRTVKVWSLGVPVPNFTLEGHDKGVNCVDYFSGGDRPYLISGADDRTCKIWDYQTRTCIQTLDGHSQNVSAVVFHPELPLIITGSEDGLIKMWHSTTYRLENSLNYGLERAWCLAVIKGSNNLVLGYDEGVVMLSLGRDEPVVSMDNSGKIVWARHTEIQTASVKALPPDYEYTDGERLPLPVKDLGSTDMYPQSLSHNPNGRFVVVCGDGEYVVYTALAWRNKAYGSALDVVWGLDASEVGIRESHSVVKIMRNFQDKHVIKTNFFVDAIFGGAYLSLVSKEHVCFYSWQTAQLIRRIDVQAKSIYWSDAGDSCIITSDSSYYILTLNREAVEHALESGTVDPEEGIEDAFDVEAEVSEGVRTGLWVGDCFVYTNMAWRLNYCVGGEVYTLFHLDRPMYLLGYLASSNRVYCMDKDWGVMSYTLLVSVVEYKSLVQRGRLDDARVVLEGIPDDKHNDLAKFLEAKGYIEEALNVAKDDEFKFELSMQLGLLDVSHELAQKIDNDTQWKQLGQTALNKGRFKIAQNALTNAQDYGGLLLLHSCLGNANGMRALSALAEQQGKFNVAFMANYILGNNSMCIELLSKANRVPEAAFYARTYAPSKVTSLVKQWRDNLTQINPKAAETLAEPDTHPTLFPNHQQALALEQLQDQLFRSELPSTVYAAQQGRRREDFLKEAQQGARMMGGVGQENGDVVIGSSQVGSAAMGTAGDSIADVTSDMYYGSVANDSVEDDGVHVDQVHVIGEHVAVEHEPAPAQSGSGLSSGSPRVGGVMGQAQGGGGMGLGLHKGMMGLGLGGARMMMMMMIWMMIGGCDGDGDGGVLGGGGGLGVQRAVYSSTAVVVLEKQYQYSSTSTSILRVSSYKHLQAIVFDEP